MSKATIDVLKGHSSSWLVLLQGDKRLLSAYVNIFYSYLIDIGKNLMRVFLSDDPSGTGRLW